MRELGLYIIDNDYFKYFSKKDFVYIKKIIDMAQKEQNYRHSLELLNVEKYDKAVKFGKICGVALVGIIALTALILSFGGYYVTASVFSLSLFEENH